MDDKRKRKRQLLTDSELKKGAMKGARYKRKTPDLLDASSLEERDISRKGKPSTAEWLCRIRGAKRGSTRAAARSAILRHLATANRRIKRMAEWGTPGPQMPHPSLWPHIDRGAEFLLFRRARACPFAGHGIELSREHIYRRQGGEFIFLFFVPCFCVPLDKAVDESPEKSRIQRVPRPRSLLESDCRFEQLTLDHF